MSVSWRTTKSGTFEVVDQLGMVGKVFGGFMLFFSSCFLYWLRVALVEYLRFGKWRDLLGALPGVAVTLIMAALFGVPGLFMALLKTRTMCNREEGLIRQVKSFGVFRRVKEIRLSDIKLLTANYKVTKSRASNRKSCGSPFLTLLNGNAKKDFESTKIKKDQLSIKKIFLNVQIIRLTFFIIEKKNIISKS